MAANRLMEALNNNGVKAMMLVGRKETHCLTVVGLPYRWLQAWRFLWERICLFVYQHFRYSRVFEVDMANTGHDITGLREFRDADVIHLNWINQGMLSLADIRKILASGKPVVWTMHDLWPAAAICHYARDCQRFKTGCRNCVLLPGGGSANDLSSRVWKRKLALYRNSNIHFVTCSKWLEGQARQSGLLRGLKVTSIPNSICQRVFHPMDKAAVRRSLGLQEKARVVLFVSQRVTDGRKGADYLVKALDLLARTQPELCSDMVVAMLGRHAEQMAGQFSQKSVALGYVSDEKRIVEIYNAADLYVLPSLEDNLPNTIMEAMACGVPCVGFKVGGIPEMIDHRKTGYVAEFRSAEDLAEGIRWTLAEADSQELSRAAVGKVARCYSQQIVSFRYIELYQELLAQKNYNL